MGPRPSTLRAWSKLQTFASKEGATRRAARRCACAWRFEARFVELVLNGGAAVPIGVPSIIPKRCAVRVDLSNVSAATSAVPFGVYG